MADQNVTLKINGDASGFLASVKAAIAETEREGKKLNLSQNASKGAPARSAEVQSFIKGNQEARAQIEKARNEENNLRATTQLLREKARELDGIARSGKNTTGQQIQQKKLAEEILVLEKQREIVKKSIDKTAASEVRSYKELLSSMGEGFKSGGLGGMKSVWGGMSGTEKFGFGATAAGGLLGAIGVAANYAGQRPIDIARMEASAISMTTGRQLGEARSGEYTYESMYGEDRAKAKEQAATSKTWKHVGDIAIAGASALGVAAAVFGTGGLAGIPALAVGALGLAGLKSSFLDKGMADPAKYAAYQSQREAQDFTTMLASLHDMSPYRKDAIERLKSTAGRDLGMERVLGLKDKGYLGKGGYLQSQMDLGFGDEAVTKASQGILGAGGSTSMALQSGTALQAERGLGLTNANQLLGQLSGTQSIPETSKKSLIDIFARGFDSSKYAEENRKYMQAVTEQVYKSGSTSEDMAARIADLIKASAGGGAPTVRGIEAGKSAYESYKAAGSATSGYAGAINLTSAMGDPWLKNSKDPLELNEIMREGTDLDENDPAVIEFANRKGMPPGGAKAFVAAQNKRIQGVTEKQLQRPKETSSTFSRRGAAGLLDQSLDTARRKSRINMQDDMDIPTDIASDRAAVTAANKARTESSMTTKETGKAGDTMTQASAKNAQISLETLSSSINKFAEDAMNAAKKLAGDAKIGRDKEAATPSTNDDGFFKRHFKVQNQAN